EPAQLTQSELPDHEQIAEPLDPLHANTPENDAHHNNNPRSDCIFQAAAQHSQLKLSACSGLIVELAETFHAHANSAPIYFVFKHNPSSPRAPPRV
ncbi:MAG: hypothetical protein ACXW50_23120, partial [Candidatus Binatia bacterium]